MCGTRGYLAPEIQGVLPRRFRTGEQFSFALDLWSLGCVVHELLTSQIPFVEIDNRCDDMDHMTGLESGFTEISGEIDMESLCEYCRGEIDFPSEILHASQVSEEGIEFVKSLLVANPSDRATAVSALQNPWLNKSNWYKDLQRQLSGLGINLDHEATSEYLRQLRIADIANVLPAGTNLGGLLQRALVEGYDTVSLMLFRSATRRLANPIGTSYVLKWLVSHGQIEVLRKMAPVGMDVNWPGSDLLAKAIDGGRADILQLLLDNGADANARSSVGHTPLQMAAKSGNPALVRPLLDAGADVNAKPAYWTGQTAFQAAAKRGYINVVQLLLDYGADINVRSWDDRTGLQIAAEDGKINLSQLVLGRAASP